MIIVPNIKEIHLAIMEKCARMDWQMDCTDGWLDGCTDGLDPFLYSLIPFLFECFCILGHFWLQKYVNFGNGSPQMGYFSFWPQFFLNFGHWIWYWRHSEPNLILVIEWFLGEFGAFSLCRFLHFSALLPPSPKWKRWSLETTNLFFGGIWSKTKHKQNNALDFNFLQTQKVCKRNKLEG